MPSTRHSDHNLADRVAGGDRDAFTMLDDRYRRPLARYASSILRRSEHDAEDIVQDVLVCAHQALLAGDIPQELRTWLYRLTRNRAIDELRRKRWNERRLDDDHRLVANPHTDPAGALLRKETIRRLVADIADLPARQRTALLARELDGLSVDEVAAQLGVSVMAAQKLAMRARVNLVKTRDARDSDCDDIRVALLEARERGVRPPEHELRHVRCCLPCHAYQRDIRDERWRLRVAA